MVPTCVPYSCRGRSWKKISWLVFYTSAESESTNTSGALCSVCTRTRGRKNIFIHVHTINSGCARGTVVTPNSIARTVHNIFFDTLVTLYMRMTRKPPFNYLCHSFIGGKKESAYVFHILPIVPFLTQTTVGSSAACTVLYTSHTAGTRYCVSTNIRTNTKINRH